MKLSAWTTTAVLAALAVSGRADTPAHSSNFSSEDGAETLGSMSAQLKWYAPSGTPHANLSLNILNQRQGDAMRHAGALVYFTDANATDSTVVEAPWVALISCDAENNLTPDIFAQAQDRGAVASILYSETSDTCVLDNDLPPKVKNGMDIFTVPTMSVTKGLEKIFLDIEPLYRYWNGTQLNQTATDVNAAVTSETPGQDSYLFVFIPSNSATSTPGNGNGATGAVPQEEPGPKKMSTSVGMIALYTVTGIVSAIFVLVIISGAVRAIRHPERYGPRHAFGPHDWPSQSRAQGITRAILDTFPVIKFHRRDPADPEAADTKDDAERGASASDAGTVTKRRLSDPHHPGWELVELPHVGADGQRESIAIYTPVDEKPPPALGGSLDATASRTSSPRAGSSSPLAIAPAATARPPRSYAAPTEPDVMPDAIGVETCPICILDFEEGDDVRVLPCAGAHRFHKDCVDPWLLELSSSCPICRQDFLALENIIASDPDLEPPHTPTTPNRPTSSAPGRFSRYVRIARHRSHRRRERDEALAAMPGEFRNARQRRVAPDPTDPHMDTVPHTIL